MNTEVTLNHSSNLIGNSNEETHFPHQFLLRDTQALVNSSSVITKIFKKLTV